MTTVTDAQRKVIGYIENNLGIFFAGETSNVAREFISLHIDKSKQKSKCNDEVTVKQIKACWNICELLDIKYHAPANKQEAQNFISQHYEAAMNKMEEIRLENEHQQKEDMQECMSNRHDDHKMIDREEMLKIQRIQDTLNYGTWAADRIYFNSLYEEDTNTENIGGW